jgi:hypothetical protein
MADAVLMIWHDGVDWFVATTAEEAEAMRAKHYQSEDAKGLVPWAPWDKPTLKITPDEGSTWQEKTCTEWIAENGPGFLCSTEW